MAFMRSRGEPAPAGASLFSTPWGEGEEAEGQPFLMPPTHFISRLDLPLLHQRLETEPGYFYICLVVPNLCLRHFGAGGGGCENFTFGGCT